MLVAIFLHFSVAKLFEEFSGNAWLATSTPSYIPRQHTSGTSILSAHLLAKRPHHPPVPRPIPNLMDGDELSSLLGMEDSFTDPTEMLDLLLANGEASFPPKVEAWEESGYNFDPSNAVLFETCAVPPIYPTFESDPHDSTDPRSVSAFLSPAHFSPPTSPGESSPGESSPEIGSSELYDEVSMSDEHCSGDENSYSTNDLLGTFPNSPIDTIDPSTLHFGSVCEIEDDSSPDMPPTASKESRKRKRTRKNPDEPSVQTAVTLPRKQLLKLSSKGRIPSRVPLTFI